MLKLCLALLLCLLVPIGAEALTADQATKIGEWAGCRDLYVTMVEAPPEETNAYFTYDWRPLGERLYTMSPIIILVNNERFSEEQQLFIFLHEVGHCLQFYNGSIGSGRYSRQSLEWGADVFASVVGGCVFGLPADTGRRAMYRISEIRGKPLKPHPSYGDPFERIAHFERAGRRCYQDLQA